MRYFIIDSDGIVKQTQSTEIAKGFAENVDNWVIDTSEPGTILMPDGNNGYEIERLY